MEEVIWKNLINYDFLAGLSRNHSKTKKIKHKLDQTADVDGCLDLETKVKPKPRGV